MAKKPWKAKFTYSITSYPKATFVGRTPFKPLNDSHKRALMKLGVFEHVGDKLLRYIGVARYIKSDDTHPLVPSDGQVEDEK